MEKRKRHYSLELVKKLVSDGDWRPTKTAVTNAWHDFECKPSDIRDTVLKLGARDFYKSMTAYDDHTLWQDVYRPIVRGILAYVKISIIDDQTVVIQFKRK